MSGLRPGTSWTPEPLPEDAVVTAAAITPFTPVVARADWPSEWLSAEDAKYWAEDAA